ncbi:hypothetical protein QTN25_010215 [Entamoeba marina]
MEVLIPPLVNLEYIDNCLINEDLICTECESGYGPSSLKHNCYPCSYFEHCSDCSQNEAQCFNCDYGYFLNNNKCDSCEVVKHCNSANCNSKNGDCDMCLFGYTLNNNECILCQEQDENCVLCSQNSSVCLECKPTYYVSDYGICERCSSVINDCVECTVHHQVFVQHAKMVIIQVETNV